MLKEEEFSLMTKQYVKRLEWWERWHQDWQHSLMWHNTPPVDACWMVPDHLVPWETSQFDSILAPADS